MESFSFCIEILRFSVGSSKILNIADAHSKLLNIELLPVIKESSRISFPSSAAHNISPRSVCLERTKFTAANRVGNICFKKILS